MAILYEFEVLATVRWNVVITVLSTCGTLVHVTSATTPERYVRDVPQRLDDQPTAAILDAARDLLAREGQGALTVRRIAAAAGGSTMNVYSRFGGKDGVIDALLIEGFEQLSEGIRRTHETDDSTHDLRTCARGYREFALTHRTHYELMFDRAIPGYVMSQRAIEAAAAALQSLADRVQRAMDDGIIRQGDALQTATIFWSACHGPVSLEIKAVGRPGTDWTAVHRRLVDALIIGLGGEAPPPGTIE
jgi:AcrR family transcriptional regulator